MKRNMAKKQAKKINLIDFPEEIDRENNIRVYGEISYENQMGTIFFEIEAILRKHQPKALFLEIVKDFAIHDKGRTLKTILVNIENIAA